MIDVDFEDPSAPYKDVEMDDYSMDDYSPYEEIEQPGPPGLEIPGGMEVEVEPSMDVAAEAPMRGEPRTLDRLDVRLEEPKKEPLLTAQHVPKRCPSMVDSVIVSKTANYPESMKMCEGTVYMARPKEGFSEIDLEPLDVDATIEGRKTELRCMNNLKAGRVVSEAEAKDYARRHGIKVIPTRWVVGPKEINGKPGVRARARCVVQDVAKGQTAQNWKA